MRVLLCVDGAAAGQLLDRALPYVGPSVEWVPIHVIDARGHLELGVLRAGVPGAGPLGPRQREAIEAAGAEHARAVMAQANAEIRARGLTSSGALVRSGEPGRMICMAAESERVDLIVVLAKRRAGPSVGPPSVGHTARFVIDHAPCPVLLLRGTASVSRRGPSEPC